MRFGLLAARSGRNAQNIIEAFADGRISGEVAAVIGNQCDEHFVTSVQDDGLPSLFLNHEKYKSRGAFEKPVLEALLDAKVDIAVSCSFSRILTKEFLDHAPSVVNSHPSILPAFQGRDADGDRPVDAAVKYGVQVLGATVHFVDELVDHGPVIIQGVVSRGPNESNQQLIEKVLAVEDRIKVQALAWISEGRLEKTGRRVNLDRSDRVIQYPYIDGCLFSPALEEGY